MQSLSERLLSSIFVIIVIVAVISGSVAFFRPSLNSSDRETPTAFVLSLINQTEKISINAGADQVILQNSAPLLTSIPIGRLTYFSWDLKNPSGKIERKFGRTVSFKAAEIGNYFVNVLGKPGDVTDSAVITSLPLKDFQAYQSKLTILQTEERTSKITPGAANKPPVASILLVYPNPAVEGGTMRFLAYAYDPDGAVVSYEWYVGTRLVSRQSSFLATKIVPGTYDYKLIVKDNRGASSTQVQRVVVKPIDPRKSTPTTTDGIAFWEVD